jgi:hypothetical protein
MRPQLRPSLPEYGAFFQAEHKRWGEIVRSVCIRLN